jgi:hypothetical protein
MAEVSEKTGSRFYPALFSALLIVSATPGHFFQPGKNSLPLKQLAGLPITPWRGRNDDQGPLFNLPIKKGKTATHLFGIMRHSFRGKQISVADPTGAALAWTYMERKNHNGDAKK